MSSDALVEWVAEAMEPTGAVTSRRMMGGHTLYCDSTVFAVVADDLLWFKSDKDSDAAWDAARCPKFTYDRDGTTATMNYRRAPDAVYDEADELRRWAALALEAGHRAAAKKKPRAAKKKPAK